MAVAQDKYSPSVLPHNEDAERMVLGAIILDHTCLHDVLSIIDENCFYHTGHRIIFTEMLELYKKQIKIDITTLIDRLDSMGKLLNAGGNFYITTLVQNVVTISNIEYHARIIRDKYTSRQLISAGEKIASLGFDESLEIPSKIDQSGKLILDIASQRDSRKIVAIGELTVDAIGRIEFAHEHQGMVTGKPSGYPQLDILTCGFQNSNLIIIGARPGKGKTALALNMAENMADPTMNSHKKSYMSLIFSLEMTKEELANRFLCSMARIDSNKTRAGYVGNRQWEYLKNAAMKLTNFPIYIDDTPSMHILQLRAKSIQFKLKYPELAIIFIDYIQLMHGDKKAENREQEVSGISRDLKALARELEIPVIALCQLNRTVESRGKYARPQLADLRESGSIEQDADVVIFPFPEIKKSTEHGQTADTGPNYIINVAKQRNGPMGDVKVYYIPQYTRFDEPAPDSMQPPSDMPGETENQNENQ